MLSVTYIIVAVWLQAVLTHGDEPGGSAQAPGCGRIRRRVKYITQQRISFQRWGRRQGARGVPVGAGRRVFGPAADALREDSNRARERAVSSVASPYLQAHACVH